MTPGGRGAPHRAPSPASASTTRAQPQHVRVRRGRGHLDVRTRAAPGRRRMTFASRSEPASGPSSLSTTHAGRAPMCPAGVLRIGGCRRAVAVVCWWMLDHPGRCDGRARAAKMFPTLVEAIYDAAWSPRAVDEVVIGFRVSSAAGPAGCSRRTRSAVRRDALFLRRRPPLHPALFRDPLEVGSADVLPQLRKKS